MQITTKYRTNKPEIMDDFDLQGETLHNALDKISTINRVLGGNQLTLQGIKELITQVPKEQEITIVDVGCGNGDMLRAISDYAAENNWNFKLIGIDANTFTIDYAKSLSLHYPEISYRCQDIFDKSFLELQYDIVLCTLTLHHFKEDQILQLMTSFNANSKIGIVINDLHRSKIAYRLFQMICFVFRLNTISKQDGLTSILRGFKKNELIDFSKKLRVRHYKLQWKWAFRYQWIIYKEVSF